MRNIWQKHHSSIFSLTFVNAEGRITSGTGFKAGNKLVTNNHVIQVENARRVIIRSVKSDGYSTGVEFEVGHLQFRGMLQDGDPPTGWDYAILNVENSEFSSAPDMELDDNLEVSIGAEIALFGFQFDQQHLSLHHGFLSSQYWKAGVNYLQLDSSVNHGNSGGPLINVDTGRVFGIVTRKATGLTQQFDSLVSAFRNNISRLEALAATGMSGVWVAGLSPIDTNIAIQVQMQQIAKEISRSANVGIGYAYHIAKIKQAFDRF